MIEFDVVAELTEVNHITEAVADTKKESFLFDSVPQTRTRGVPIDRVTKLYRETAVAVRCLASIALPPFYSRISQRKVRNTVHLGPPNTGFQIQN